LVVAIGDSIVDGAESRVDADRSWPSQLARFDRDVLSLRGITHVVLLEGLNDIGFPGISLDGPPLASPEQTPTVDTVIEGYLQLIARAHARGVKLISATLTPFEGTTSRDFTQRPRKRCVRRSIPGYAPVAPSMG
jgi:lysophospholipase L1-like esterase